MGEAMSEETLSQRLLRENGELRQQISSDQEKMKEFQNEMDLMRSALNHRIDYGAEILEDVFRTIRSFTTDDGYTLNPKAEMLIAGFKIHARAMSVKPRWGQKEDNQYLDWTKYFTGNN